MSATGTDKMGCIFLVWDMKSLPLIQRRRAIDKARMKSLARRIRVNFRLSDALALSCLGMSFDTVIDSGLSHVWSDEMRVEFVNNLGAVLVPGGRYSVLCFNERETRDVQRQVTKGEIRDTF